MRITIYCILVRWLFNAFGAEVAKKQDLNFITDLAGNVERMLNDSSLAEAALRDLVTKFSCLYIHFINKLSVIINILSLNA